MIRVEEKFEDYCKMCPEFEPMTSRETLWANNEPYMTKVVVECEHAKKCRAIYKHLKTTEETK